MGLAVELFTNLFQAVMFIGFLYLFFDKPQGKLKRLLPFLGGILSLFAITSYFTLSGINTGTEAHYIDSFLYVFTLEIYALIFLRGKIHLRIVIPIIGFAVNTLISYTFGYFASFVSGIPLEEAFTVSTAFRYFCMAVINLTTALALWLILRFGSKKIRLTGATEVIIFAIIPLLCIVILYCGFFAYQESSFNTAILIYILIICLVMVIIAVLTCIMLVRISRANKIKTELLLSKQRENLYEENTLATNNQIEKISVIKHDMKNNLMSIKNLILSGNPEQALSLCDNASDKLEATYTPISSSNPVLNAIVNVKLEKASSLGIDLTVSISETLTNVSSADTVSLIGNLCDNAIEYLADQPKNLRQIDLHIHSQFNYNVISCKNRIAESVLESNPNFNTTKADKSNHGIGIATVKRIAKDYDGDFLVSEENGWLTVTVLLCK